ncbi:uncharacterized protein LY89DRAFT_785111 [Mollisia scopiformis]|uniref:Rhodopsin domain-containing protein n=1 Tax=Mollisia scopiformis TaxID=149040 RepID=A0A194WZM0_MOLSC|nr:uncharacterized protein LY89DRAFT_785111 [Mollisia scopiformis]KUJ13393.1 hypothetical protein LY89DRAFT_785111 [Mollisia scopiformis]
MTEQILGAAPPPGGVTPNFDHPEDVLATINLVSGILGIALMAPFVIGRIFIKVHILKNMVLEDYICVVAWLLATGYFLTGLFMGKHGGGNHEWEVTKENMVGFQQALYADTIVYGPAAWTTKTTLLLIFARVFSPFRKTVLFIYVFIGLMFCYYFPVMIIKIRVCTPIEGLWNPDIHAECINQSQLFWTDTIMSAATDFVILVLPIPLVWSLQITLKKKMKISALLGAGGIATGASIVRLILVFQPNSFADETVSFVRFNLLGVAEIGIGIICACIPAFNVLFTRWKTEYGSRNSRKTEFSAEVKLSRLRSSNRGIRVVTNPLSRSQSSYIEVGSPRDTLFSQSQKTLKSQLSVDAMNRHTISVEGGGYDNNGVREFQRVHEWMQRPYVSDSEVGRAA